MFDLLVFNMSKIYFCFKEKVYSCDIQDFLIFELCKFFIFVVMIFIVINDNYFNRIMMILINQILDFFLKLKL